MFLFCGLLPSWGARNLELNASGITFPFFDEHGKLTHRLTAKTGTKAGELQNLQEVELHYFSATEPNVIVQKLRAADATWDAKKELLAGTGPIEVATEENRLTGVGFDFALGTSLLRIHREFKMENDEVIATGDHASVELIVQRAGERVKVRDVKRCEVVGHLQMAVQPTAKKRYDFTRAHSERAIYDGGKRVIEFPERVRYTRKDGTDATSNSLTVKLPPAGKSTAPKKE